MQQLKAVERHRFYKERLQQNRKAVYSNISTWAIRQVWRSRIDLWVFGDHSDLRVTWAMVKLWKVCIGKAHLQLSIREMEFVPSTYCFSTNWITIWLSASRACSVNSGRTWRRSLLSQSLFSAARSTCSYSHCTLQKPDSLHRIGEQTLARTARSWTTSEQRLCGTCSEAIYYISHETSWWHYQVCKWVNRFHWLNTTRRLFYHRQLHTHSWLFRGLRKTWHHAVNWEEVDSQELKNIRQVSMESHSAYFKRKEWCDFTEATQLTCSL